MAQKTANQSAKGSKAGRNSGRPSQRVYVATNRREVNKRKNIARHAKRMAAKAVHRAAWQAKQDRKASFAG